MMHTAVLDEFSVSGESTHVFATINAQRPICKEIGARGCYVGGKLGRVAKLHAAMHIYLREVTMIESASQGDVAGDLEGGRLYHDGTVGPDNKGGSL
jgi:hypothetical protein